MLPGHWLRGLSRSSKNRCGRAGRKPLRRCGTETGAGARSESYCGDTERKLVQARGANLLRRCGRKSVREHGAKPAAAWEQKPVCAED